MNDKIFILKAQYDRQFAASSYRNDDSAPPYSRYWRYSHSEDPEIDPSSWYAAVQDPNQWIQVTFDVLKIFDEVEISPTQQSGAGPREYVRASTLYCGLVDFSVRAVGTLHMESPTRTIFPVGMWYCRTVRLVIHTWQLAIGLRWEIREIIGLYLFLQFNLKHFPYELNKDF